MKRVILTGLIAAAIAAAYFAGASRTVMDAKTLEAVPTVPAAVPAEVTIKNPTEVLLGEASAPPELLKGTVAAAPDLIVPKIPK